jgi:hypothetical protein
MKSVTARMVCGLQWLTICLGLLFFAFGPVAADPGTTCIAGLQGWWQSGDHIQFLGDCTGQSLTEVCTTECECSNVCGADLCFRFRTVTSVDPVTCEGTAGNSYGVGADFCFLLGSAPGVTRDCLGCSSNDLCLSIWKVLVFNAAPGDYPEGVLGSVEIQKAPGKVAKFLKENILPSNERSLDAQCSSDPQGAEAPGCIS